MPIFIDSGRIIYSLGSIPAQHPVLEAREIGDMILVVYDYMSFPRLGPARNLFAYSAGTGAELWQAEDIGFGPSDAYTNIISDAPLVVGNFAGYNCEIDTSTGRVVGKAFTK